jgi:hypothetical protein
LEMCIGRAPQDYVQGAVTNHTRLLSHPGNPMQLS